MYKLYPMKLNTTLFANRVIVHDERNGNVILTVILTVVLYLGKNNHRLSIVFISNCEVRRRLSWSRQECAC